MGYETRSGGLFLGKIGISHVSLLTLTTEDMDTFEVRFGLDVGLYCQQGMFGRK